MKEPQAIVVVPVLELFQFLLYHNHRIKILSTQKIAEISEKL